MKWLPLKGGLPKVCINENELGSFLILTPFFLK